MSTLDKQKPGADASARVAGVGASLSPGQVAGIDSELKQMLEALNQASAGKEAVLLKVPQRVFAVTAQKSK